MIRRAFLTIVMATLVITPVPVSAEDFAVVNTYSIPQTGASNVTYERWRDVYVTFSAPAINVKADLYKVSSGELLGTAEYPSGAYTSDRKSFSLGWNNVELAPSTEYRYIVEGTDRITGVKASKESFFSTKYFPTDFKVTEVRIDSPKLGNGSEDPTTRDFLVTFNYPARAVKMYIVKNNNTNELLQNVSYKEEHYQIGQKSFAMTVSSLVPGTEYRYGIDGQEPTGGYFAEKSGTFYVPSNQFQITNLDVLKVDVLGNAAEDVRSFRIGTTHSYSKLVISIWESPTTSITQAPYLTHTVQGNGTLDTAYVSPGWFTKKLKSTTAYVYRVTAYKYGASEDMNMTREGSFTTSAFSVVTPSVSLIADRTSVIPGQSSKITWTVSNFAADGVCHFAGPGATDEGWKKTTGSWIIVWPKSTETFTLECKDGVGAHITKTITIAYDPSVPQPENSLTVSPEGTLIRGGTGTVSWTSKNAAYCMAQAQGVDWSGKKAPSGTETFRVTQSQQSSASFTIVCYNDAGASATPYGAFRSLGDAANAFAVASHRAEPQTDSDGSKMESTRDFYVTFSRPAKDVSLNVYEKNTNKLIQEYSYPSYLYQSGQTSFAVGSVMNLVAGTAYRYVVYGKDAELGTIAQVEDVFTTRSDFNVKPVEDVKKEEKKPSGDKQIEEIKKKAKLLGNAQVDVILTELKALRDKVEEQANEIKFLKKVSGDFQKLNDEMRQAVNTFVTYGIDDNTKNLGAGERAAVVNSYKAAFNKLPDTDEELEDLFRIANGRFPSKTNADAEKGAKADFRKIYKRVANMKNPQDSAAITVMAYGLRQVAENRNLKSESAGIAIFRKIYGRIPQSTEDWNIMQAITYSGASRKTDSDKDSLSDEDEKSLGTDQKNPDTDGDGYLDGEEVENGHNPLGA